MADLKNKPAENIEENIDTASSVNETPTEATLSVAKVVTIAEDDVDYIIALPGKKKYENTEPGSRNHGKSFRTFQFINKKGAMHLFNVPEEEFFCQDFDKQNLFEVRLIENDQDFYNLAGYKTYGRAERQATFKEKRELHQAKLTLTLGSRATVEEIEDL